MLQRIVKWLMALFAKRSPSVVPLDIVPVTHESLKRPASNPFQKYAGWAAQAVIISRGRGFTPEEEAQARDAGVVFADAPKPQGEKPAETDDISDGAIHEYQLADGQEKVVFLRRPGVVRIIGTKGTELREVKDSFGTFTPAGTITPYESPRIGGGTYAFRVKTVGGWVGVTLMGS